MIDDDVWSTDIFGIQNLVIIVFVHIRSDTPAPAGTVAAIVAGGNRRRLHRKLARFAAAGRTRCPWPPAVPGAPAVCRPGPGQCVRSASRTCRRAARRTRVSGGSSRSGQTATTVVCGSPLCPARCSGWARWYPRGPLEPGAAWLRWQTPTVRNNNKSNINNSNNNSI